jgi:hypothetical protein
MITQQRIRNVSDEPRKIEGRKENRLYSAIRTEMRAVHRDVIHMRGVAKRACGLLLKSHDLNFVSSRRVL